MRASEKLDTTILVRYVLFAIVSTVVNLGTQEAVVRASPIEPLVVSILAGTVAGFVVKYVLDKYWIFYDETSSAGYEVRKITLYGLFSVFTTLIFWATEVAFWTVWGTAAAKYTGAVLGLAFGYALKYGLDRRFVFRERRA